MILPAFQLLSLGTFPPGAISTMTAETTLTTAFGGEPKDFNSVKLFCKASNANVKLQVSPNEVGVRS